MALSRAEGESRALVFTDDSGVCRPVSILTSSCVAASTSAADADWLEYEAGVDEECTSDFPCAWVSAAKLVACAAMMLRGSLNVEEIRYCMKTGCEKK